MTHAGFIAGIVLAATVVTATTAVAMGPGKGRLPTFQELDANSDGEVTKAELDAHRSARFAKADTDGDGKLSADEIQTAAQAHASERATKMMERHDADNDGFLTEDEMPKPRRAGKMFNRMDADGNGAISEQEFAEAKDRMKRRHGKRGGDQVQEN